MRRLMAAVVALAILILVFLGLLWVFQRRLMYFPDSDVPPPAQVNLPAAEPVTFSTADGLALHGWFVPSGQSLAKPPARPTILVFNGNAGNRAYRAPLAQALQALGFPVLLFDYRGYGENQGAPTEAGLIADARAARDYLRARADVDAARIVYFGESLGTGVAVRLAAEQAPAALILVSPFTSIVDLGQLHYPLLPVRLLVRDRFASIDVIGQVSCPLLVIAGDRDGMVPAAQSRRLYEAAPGAKTLLMIPGADHNDAALLWGREMMQTIDRFLR
jgi:fermentation-respiration switch protein FrsA (DUF1100 family)